MNYGLLLLSLAILVVMGFVLSLVIGDTSMSSSQLWAVLTSTEADRDSNPVLATQALILAEIRLPRALLGLTIGLTLGLSGAAMQGFLRNPLAEPGLIGVSGSGALGAVLAIYTGLSLMLPLALPLVAVASAMVAVVLLYWLSRGASILVLILSGIAISSLTGALTSLVLNLSSNPFAAMEIIQWMLGSITDRSMVHVWLVLPFMLAGWIMLLSGGAQLDALSLGDDTARSMGVNIPRLRWLVITGTGLAVGAATAVSGVIGFLGLVVPHLLRPLVGHHPGRLLPASALGGATLLLLADVLVRLLPMQAEMKLGVVTALLGAPFFFWLILRTRAGEF
ncbi:MAG: iron ABC transporter permease [Gammaproteobacteria bacterium]|nr:iron ABC transporter permease [Gammaproteobacteria bacterium]